MTRKQADTKATNVKTLNLIVVRVTNPNNSGRTTKGKLYQAYAVNTFKDYVTKKIIDDQGAWLEPVLDNKTFWRHATKQELAEHKKEQEPKITVHSTPFMIQHTAETSLSWTKNKTYEATYYSEQKESIKTHNDNNELVVLAPMRFAKAFRIITDAPLKTQLIRYKFNGPTNNWWIKHDHYHYNPETRKMTTDYINQLEKTGVTDNPDWIIDPEKLPQTKNTTGALPMNITNPTLIDGTDAEDYSDQDLIDSIKGLEQTIESLGKVKATSKKIKKIVEQHTANIAKLVTILDARN